MQQDSQFISVSNHQLHLRHIWQHQDGPPVLMLHGTIENGKIFYSRSGKGLACYLAKQGFNVFVADFRGRGKSTPSIKDAPDHGQTHYILEDIPAFIDYVYQQTEQPIHLVCHSWGGVLLASAMVRFPELRKKIRSQLCFGTKRQITVWNFERLLKISLGWKGLAPLIARRVGYIDAPGLKFGSDFETYEALMHSIGWVNISEWKDPVDNFDYAAAAENYDWPPTWHLTGIKDHALGHAQDVQLFISECDNKHAEFKLLSKSSGSKVDYDHINILTHPLAETDHFPMLSEWMRQH